MLSTAPVAPAIYVRWSTDEQGSGTTLEEQQQTCLNFLADRGWPARCDLMFIDDGYSAGSLERPAMKRLRKAVHAGQVDAVVVYKLDRLTRNIVDAVELVLKEWEGRCALVSVTQSSIDTTSALGRQFFTLMASFAEFEREMIRDRTMSGKKRRAKQGRNPGFRPPFGYKSGETPGEIRVDEERAVTVRRVYELFAAGVSTEGIAAQLNREGIENPSGVRRWTHATVRYILTNPLYTGRLEYGRSSRNSPQKRSVVGKANTVYKTPRHAMVPDAVSPIIDPSLWQTVRSALERRSMKTGFACRAASSQYMLTGTLRCRCGGACAGVENRGVRYYRCRVGTGTCESSAVRTEVVDAAVLAAIREQLRSRISAGLVDDTRARAEEAKRTAEAAVANLKAKLAEIKQQREKARKDYREGDLTGRLYSELMAELDEREGEARMGLQDAEQALTNPAVSLSDKAWLIEHLDEFMTDAWLELDMARKKQLLRLLVPRLIMYRKKGDSLVELEITVAIPHGEGTAPVTHVQEHHLRDRRKPEAGGQASD